MLSAKQGSHWYHYYNVFGMTRPGIDPTPILTYRTRSGRSTTWAIAEVTSGSFHTEDIVLQNIMYLRFIWLDMLHISMKIQI